MRERRKKLQQKVPLEKSGKRCLGGEIRISVKGSAGLEEKPLPHVRLLMVETNKCSESLSRNSQPGKIWLCKGSLCCNSPQYKIFKTQVKYYVWHAYVFVCIVLYNGIWGLQSVFSKTFFNLQCDYVPSALINLCMVYMKESEEMP